MARIDFEQRLRQVAAADPDRAAFIGIDASGAETVLSWSELVQRSGEQSWRRDWRSPAIVVVPTRGDAGSFVHLVSALRSPDVSLVVDPATPGLRSGEFSERIAAATGLDVWLDGALAAAAPSGAPPMDLASSAALLLTGGTTGTPKLVVKPDPPFWDPVRGAPLLFQRTGWQPGQLQLLAGGWFHAAAYSHLVEALMSGNTVLCPQLFDPRLVIAAMERHQPAWTQLTPSHLQLLVPLLPDKPQAVASLRGVLHTAGPCAPSTREAWIAAIGAERLFEMYAATEGLGVTLCRADEWLERPGTVGRGFFTRIRIYGGRDGAEVLGANQTGTIFMKTVGPATQLAQPIAARDGYRTVNDVGYLDDDGYLYLAGRSDDMVVVGGENVYLDTVVAELLRHEAVDDAAVLPVPDEMLGHRLVALVVPNRDGDLRMELLTHCLARLAPREIPGDIVTVPDLQRTPAGKLNRAQLAELLSENPAIGATR